MIPDTAMLLAAGLGKRMRPLTDTLPKPMIKVSGRPMIDYILDAAAQAGLARAVINVHYLAGIIERHVARRAAPAVIISDERARLLDSGGGVKKALPLIGRDTFFVLNADSFWIDGPRNNLVRLAERWNPAEMDILLMLSPTATAIGWGNRGDYALLQDGRLRRAARHEITPFAYAGAGIWKAALFDPMPEVFSLNRLFDQAEAAGRLFGMPLDGQWLHVGTPEAVIEAERCIERSQW